MHNFSYNREVKRKIFHLSSCVLGISLILFGRDIVLPITIFLTIIAFLIDGLRNRNNIIRGLYNKSFNVMTRPEELTKFTGATWLLFSASITILVFNEIPAATGLLFLSFGDSISALIGRKFGKTKIGNKSLEGSISFFLSFVVVAFFIPGLNVWIGIISAFFAAIIELVGIHKLNDNLTIPIATALIVQILGGLI